MAFPGKKEYKVRCEDCGTVVTMKGEKVDEKGATVNLLSLTPWTAKEVGEGFRCPECSIEQYREMMEGSGPDQFDPTG